ncbi:MAG: M23 family metallopeptidase [Gemmatimonadota bacterium]|nr:MAG: M23 family metallopeptidase [Gemmatimonadota bacterium]
MRYCLALLCVLAAQGPVTVGSTRAEWSKPDVSWSPSRPIQGTIVQFTLRPDRLGSWSNIVAVEGVLEDQPLHFERAHDGHFHALAGIPIYAQDSIAVELTLWRAAGAREHLTRYVPVERGTFSVAQLRVDPRYVEPPDSALALRIVAERDSVRRVVQRSHSTPRIWGDRFVLPRDSRVTSGFGQRREFNGEYRSTHMGLDLAGHVGAPVAATNRGVVVLVSDFYYSGKLVYLDHGQGLLTAYLHLSETFVAVGDTVGRGEPIGRVGASGRVTGPHLHWTARYGAVIVNPRSLLELDVSFLTGGS